MFHLKTLKLSITLQQVFSLNWKKLHFGRHLDAFSRIIIFEVTKSKIQGNFDVEDFRVKQFQGVRTLCYCLFCFILPKMGKIELNRYLKDSITEIQLNNTDNDHFTEAYFSTQAAVSQYDVHQLDFPGLTKFFVSK